MQAGAELMIRNIAADVNHSAVHPGSKAPPRDRRIRLIRKHAQKQNDSTGHIFPEKVPGLAADDDGRQLVLEGLHVDAHAVSHVAAHHDPAAAHGVIRARLRPGR